MTIPKMPSGKIIQPTITAKYNPIIEVIPRLARAIARAQRDRDGSAAERRALGLRVEAGLEIRIFIKCVYADMSGHAPDQGE